MSAPGLDLKASLVTGLRGGGWDQRSNTLDAQGGRRIDLLFWVKPLRGHPGCPPCLARRVRVVPFSGVPARVAMRKGTLNCLVGWGTWLGLHLRPIPTATMAEVEWSTWQLALQVFPYARTPLATSLATGQPPHLPCCCHRAYMLQALL